jgi:hypothetical protein
MKRIFVSFLVRLRSNQNLLLRAAKNRPQLLGIFVKLFGQCRMDRDNLERFQHGRLRVGQIATSDQPAASTSGSLLAAEAIARNPKIAASDTKPICHRGFAKLFTLPIPLFPPARR